MENGRRSRLHTFPRILLVVVFALGAEWLQERYPANGKPCLASPLQDLQPLRAGGELRAGHHLLALEVVVPVILVTHHGRIVHFDGVLDCLLLSTQTARRREVSY